MHIYFFKLPGCEMIYYKLLDVQFKISATTIRTDNIVIKGNNVCRLLSSTYCIRALKIITLCYLTIINE
jgi:hypothetical protein